MLAVCIARAGGPDVLTPQSLDCPEVKSGEVLIKIEYCGVNRLDLDQRRKGKKSSNGEPYCPGLECSGYIADIGPDVSSWKKYERVCAILEGGAYADKVVVPVRQLFKLTHAISLEDAACFPEAACTIWRAFTLGGLKKGTSILIHEACGYYGIFAIQMAIHMGALVFVATESDAKIEFYKKLGAFMCINWNDEHFADKVRQHTPKTGGVEVILDSWVLNLEDNLKVLSVGGMIILCDIHGDTTEILPLDWLTATHAIIQVLDRARNLDQHVVDAVKKDTWPAILDGSIKPYRTQCFQLSKANDAHRYMEKKNIGQKMLSALASFAPSLEPFASGGMLAEYIKGKTLLACRKDAEVWKSCGQTKQPRSWWHLGQRPTQDTKEQHWKKSKQT